MLRYSRFILIKKHGVTSLVEFIIHCVNIFAHLDEHMNALLQTYGVWTYLIIFLIVFCETGLVFTPFLPGDSLLFVVGTFAAVGSLKLSLSLLLLMTAAILGDTANYWLGHLLAPKIFRHQRIRFLKQEYLERTENFFAKYGSKTIIIARFVPIIRTFAPFLAGAASMRYRRFLSYNVIGGVLWVACFVLGGYFFGNIPFVKENFSLVILLIIILSLIPAIREFISHRKNKI